jgi:hypothetical protein
MFGSSPGGELMAKSPTFTTDVHRHLVFNAAQHNLKWVLWSGTWKPTGTEQQGILSKDGGRPMVVLESKRINWGTIVNKVRGVQGRTGQVWVTVKWW